MTTMKWPAAELAGSRGQWTFVDMSGRATELTGVFLGAGTSFKPDHMHHRGQPYADRHQRCSSCRWIEVRLFREDATEKYLVVTRGTSVIPGEKDRITCTLVFNAFQAVEAVTTRRAEGNGEAFLNKPSAYMLAQAAQHDLSVKEAYLNRAVA